MKTITEQALMCKKYINDEKKGNFFYKELKELVDICQGKRINLKFEDITDSQRNEVIRIAKECGIDVVQQSVKKKQGTHIEQSPENRSETKIEIVQAVVNKPQKSTIEISITSIRKNPYRILGVLAGASIKEITKQANNLKKYLAADAEPPTDYSFSDLDGLNRTTEDIETAAANLNLDEDRMLSALFWFWKGNEITDEPALEAIKSGDLQQAYDIWGRLTQGNEVTAKNCSAFHNYSVCYLIFGDDEARLKQGIVYQLRVLESDFWQELKNAVTDLTYKITKKEVQLLFFKTLTANLGEETLIRLIPNIDFAAKQDFMKSVSQKFTANINAQIETARKTRTTNKQQAAAAGETLYKNTKDDLAQLKEIFGEQDFSYSNVADKVANEILQCAIDYFKQYKDSSLDPGIRTMSVFKTAKMVAVGNSAKQRCEENIKTVQEWIDDKPKREMQNIVKKDFEFIANKLQQFQTLYVYTIGQIEEFVVSCKPKLDNIKTALGASSDLYIKISSTVVGVAQGKLVEFVNSAQENAQEKVQSALENIYIIAPYIRKSMNDTLIIIISDAIEVTNLLDQFDMNPELRSRFNSNKNTLRDISKQLINNGRVLAKNVEELNSHASIPYQQKGRMSDETIGWLTVLVICGIIALIIYLINISTY